MKGTPIHSWSELVVIPLGLVLGWWFSTVVFPSEGPEPAVPGAQPLSHEPQARFRPVPANPVDAKVLVNLDTVDACRRSLGDLRHMEGVHPLVVSALRDRALRAWLDLDVSGALAHAESNTEGRSQNFGKDLFRVWIDLDVESAVEAYSLASPALVSSTFEAFFIELAHRDPDRALRMLAQPKWDLDSIPWYRHGEVLRKTYAIMGRRDPRAAIARCRLDQENGVHVGGYGHSGTTAILKVWAESDPTGAWEHVQNHDETYGLEHIASYLLLEHPEVAGQVEPDQMSGICREFTERDLEEALRFAETRPEGDEWRREVYAHAARFMATAEPERALELYRDAGGSSETFRDDGIFRQAFLTLNARDPEQALALLPDVPEEKRAVALGGILTHEFAVSHEAACVRCRELLSQPETKDLVLPALEEALSWGHGSGNHDLAEVVEALPEIRSEVRSYMLEGWVRVAPEAAAAFIAEEANRLAGTGEEFFPEESLKRDPTNDAISELAFSRPEFVSEWVFTLPEGELRDQVAESLAANWGRFDHEAAMAWVEELPEGAMKEKAVKMLKASSAE